MRCVDADNVATSCADRYESLAYFTSIGPTTDNRIKPDIVAPGTTISATLCASDKQLSTFDATADGFARQLPRLSLH